MFYFHLGEDSHFDSYFWNGWFNHQLDGAFFKMMLPPTTGVKKLFQHQGVTIPAGTFESMIFRLSPGGICDRFLEGKHIIFSIFLGQLMVDWWFGFLGSPKMKGIVTSGYPSQTTVCPIEASTAKPNIQDGGSMDPPRSGWEVPYENRGLVTQVR